MRLLRLMSWNVRSLRDDRRAVVTVIKECGPDVLFVQEAPRFLRAQTTLAALARESGLVVAAGGLPAASFALLMLFIFCCLNRSISPNSDELLPTTPPACYPNRCQCAHDKITALVALEHSLESRTQHIEIRLRPHQHAIGVGDVVGRSNDVQVVAFLGDSGHFCAVADLNSQFPDETVKKSYSSG